MAEIRVTVRVRPGASRSVVGGSYGEPPQLTVAVHARPVDGAANEAVIAAVADALDVRPRQVSIAGGHTSRTKVLVVSAPDEDARALRARIDHLLGQG